MNGAIRKIQFDELEQLLALYKDFNPDDPVLDVDGGLRAHWQRIFDNPDIHYFVTEHNGVLSSSCMLVVVPNLTRNARPFGVLQNVVVDASLRGKGVGSQLLTHMLDFAWEQDCYQVLVQVRPGTEAFYERVGFQSGSKSGMVAKPV